MLHGDEDGRRNIARIKIARRCEEMDQSIYALLAISEQGAGELDCELPCAPATSRDSSLMAVSWSYRLSKRPLTMLTRADGGVFHGRLDHSSSRS